MSLGTNFGYVPDERATRLYNESLPTLYNDQLSDLAAKDDQQDVFLYRALQTLIAKSPTLSPVWIKDGRLVSCNQSNIGSCVGVANSRALSLELALDIVLRGLQARVAMFSGEVCYGLGREAGGMLGGGDGSYGSAQAKADTTMGMLSCQKYGNYDLTTYSVATCRQFGSRGVPQDLKALAQQHTLKASVNVKSADEAWTVLRSGHPILQCSNVGWAGNRNDFGYTRQSGSWSHALCICGRITLKGARYFLIQNSWGNYSSGGYYLDQPHGSFYASYDSVNYALKSGDSFTKVDVQGYKMPVLDWSTW